MPLSLSKIQTNNIELSPGLVIGYPNFDYIPQNNITLNFHIHNSSFHLLNNTEATCSLHIYNSSGNHVFENSSIPYDEDGGDFYYYIPNLTINTEYNYILNCNSSEEEGFLSNNFITISNNRVSRPEGEINLLLVIILLPLIFGVFLIVGAVTLGEEHGVLKIGLYLLSLFMILASLHYATLSAVNYLDLIELEELLGTTTYWISIVLFAIVSYFMIYLIIKTFHTAAQKKKEKLEY